MSKSISSELNILPTQPNESLSPTFTSDISPPVMLDIYETGEYFKPEEEFLLCPDDRVSFNIRYPSIYQHCIKQRAQHWFEHEV